MKRFPFPLRFTIPAILLVFGTILGVSNLQREISQSFQRVEEDVRNSAKFSGNQLSSTLEYLYRRGDVEQAEVAISMIRSDANLDLSILYDENNRVLLATRYQLRNQFISGTPAASLAKELAQVRQTLTG